MYFIFKENTQVIIVKCFKSLPWYLPVAEKETVGS